MNASDVELSELLKKSANILEGISDKNVSRNDSENDSCYGSYDRDLTHFNYYCEPVYGSDEGKYGSCGEFNAVSDTSLLLYSGNSVMGTNTAPPSLQHSWSSPSYSRNKIKMSQQNNNYYLFRDKRKAAEWTCPYFGYNYYFESDCNAFEGSSYMKATDVS